VAEAKGAGIFPLPLVEVPRPGCSRSRRVQQRARRSAAAAELANGAITALNKLHTSYTSSIHMQTRNPSDILTKSTLRAVAHVQSCAERFVSRLAPSFSGASSDDMFVSRDPADLSHAAYAFTTDSLPLAAEKVALPSEPGCVNLLDILPPDIARVYAEPNPDLFRPVDERPKARYACRVRTPQDYVLIIKRLHELKMVVFTTG
jgi:hypothetical protein